MPTINSLTDESIKKLKQDHERLRYEIQELRSNLRTLRGLSDDAANSVATTDTIIPGRSGTTPGGPIMCQRKRINSTPAFVDYGPEVPVYSWLVADSSDPASEPGGILWIFIEQDIHGTWWFTGEGETAAVGLVGGCLDEDHPGRGEPFDILLGVWNTSTNKWNYSGTPQKAIDWRYDVPYPDAGATGLFEARTSDEFGTIWEVVSLDCSSPGPCSGGY